MKLRLSSSLRAAGRAGPKTRPLMIMPGSSMLVRRAIRSPPTAAAHSGAPRTFSAMPHKNFNTVQVRSNLVRTAQPKLARASMTPRHQPSVACGKLVSAGIRRFVSQAPRKNIGILAADLYFPHSYVSQTDLEGFDKVGAGKYTKGLGQDTMAFVGDREDTVSMSLNAVENVMRKFGVRHDQIGRLEVGTETIVDKSKAIKTYLMGQFQEKGITNLEGVDNINACYGGTAALFNTLNWVESSNWNGKYGLVVAGDIAVYAPGPARPTGGAGVVAMLVGPDAPLAFDAGLRGHHFEDAYDFYKPDFSVEFPTVDGPLSNECYLRALDSCYNQYRQSAGGASLKDFDYVLFHSPYTKLVQKSVARLMYLDFLANPSASEFSEVQQFKDLDPATTYVNRDLEKEFVRLSEPTFNQKTLPGQYLPRHLGNSYTGSLYTCLLSAVSQPSFAQAKKILMFSYGSGLASSMFSLTVNPGQPNSPFSAANIAKQADIVNRISARQRVSPERFTEILATREKTLKNDNFLDSTDLIAPGSYYLAGIDDLYRRTYKKKE